MSDIPRYPREEVDSLVGASLHALENRLGYRFKSPELLELALTHRSYQSSASSRGDNERLEFLGDSVIGLIVCDYLYNTFPEMQEDRLSKIRSYIVSQKNLFRWAESISLGTNIKLSESERQSGGARKSSIISGCFESLIGAIFLDGGFESARKIVVGFLKDVRFNDLENDSKSELQEISQERFGVLPKYKIIKEEGPAHNKIFEIEVEINGVSYGSGIGHSKKEAQKCAAEAALKKLKF